MPHQNKTVKVLDLGLQRYKTVWDLQRQLQNEIVALKLQNRDTENPALTPNYLIFCEHYPVFTLGNSGNRENMLFSQTQLEAMGYDVFHIERGGDVTYHGPGQLVGYPIFDLDNFFTDLHKYLRTLEDAIIRVCNGYGLNGGIMPGLTGVWVDTEQNPRKITAMGIKCSRWVTMHGFAFNINTDLTPFKLINPCGITDKPVTSLHLETGQKMDFEKVKLQVLESLAVGFGFEYRLIQSGQTTVTTS